MYAPITPHEPILAWHFGGGRLGYGDNRRVKIGVKQRYKQRYRGIGASTGLVMCLRGMHASANVFDALRFATGPILRYVELSGDMIVYPDKICAEYRKPLWRIDAAPVMKRFFELTFTEVNNATRDAGSTEDAFSCEFSRLWEYQQKAQELAVVGQRVAAHSGKIRLLTKWERRLEGLVAQAHKEQEKKK